MTDYIIINLKITNQTISFKLSTNEIDKFTNLFLNKDNLINLYYNKYKDYGTRTISIK